MALLAMGAIGDDVGALQQRLVEAGYDVPQGELGAARFGSGTLHALLAFQAAHVDRLGHPLKQDGVVGPATEYALDHPGEGGSKYIAPGWRCSPSEMRESIRPVVVQAVSDLSLPTFEDPDGSNDGPNLKKYGIGQNDDGSYQNWCAYALSYWYSFTEGGTPFRPRVMASALKVRDWAQAAGLILPVDATLQAGDVGVILRANLHGHVAMVVDNNGGALSCIEGNASNAVRGTMRRRDSFTCVVRPVPIV